MAGPFAAAAVLPAAVMMAGLVTVWGVGFGLASAFVSMRREGIPAPGNDGGGGAEVSVPRLVVAGAEPTVAAPKPAAPKDGGLKAPGPGVPPKPAKPGGAPPKPKSAAARPATARRKAMPAVKVAPLKFESTPTAKGISLPRLSIQHDKPGPPAKD